MAQTTEVHVSQIYPGTAYQLVGTNSGATQDVYLTLSGTANQININKTGTTITLSTPQNIDTTASPTFASVQVTNMILTGVTSDPGSPSAGQIWFRSDTKQFVGYNGTTNVIIG